VLEWVVSAALRETGNFPIQSTAQGTVKLVMAQTEDDRHEMKLMDLVHPQLQIHDELLYACHKSVAEDWGAHVAYRFENCVELEVPIKAGVVTAQTWGSLPK
jgi:DNA polymerase-1